MEVQKARCFARSSASSLVVVGLAAWAVLKGSRATALDGTAVDVVALAFFKCRSASRTNPTTGHVTTKLAAATKEKICDRFIMSLPFGDRDISGHAASRCCRNEKFKYFANNADSCNPPRAGPETS